MPRTPFVVGNWKLNLTLSEALALVTELKNQLGAVRGVEVGVAPVATAIAAVAKRLEGTGIHVAGQNTYFAEKGAFTGELSPSLLKDAGCTCCIVGHSERRQLFGETDENVGKKAVALLKAGLTPIICVGETLAERDGGTAFKRVETQLGGALAGIPASDAARVVIAYEPVWAIGTGRTATPDQAQEVHDFIRGRLVERWGKEPAETVRLQYGGSVKADNAAELMARPNIDGALVGGAALKADSFVAIVKGARRS